MISSILFLQTRTYDRNPSKQRVSANETHKKSDQTESQIDLCQRFIFASYPRSARRGGSQRHHRADPDCARKNNRKEPPISTVLSTRACKDDNDDDNHDASLQFVCQCEIPGLNCCALQISASNWLLCFLPFFDFILSINNVGNRHASRRRTTELPGKQGPPGGSTTGKGASNRGATANAEACSSSSSRSAGTRTTARG